MGDGGGRLEVGDEGRWLDLEEIERFKPEIRIIFVQTDAHDVTYH